MLCYTPGVDMLPCRQEEGKFFILKLETDVFSLPAKSLGSTVMVRNAYCHPSHRYIYNPSLFSVLNLEKRLATISPIKGF